MARWGGAHPWRPAGGCRPGGGRAAGNGGRSGRGAGGGGEPRRRGARLCVGVYLCRQRRWVTNVLEHYRPIMGLTLYHGMCQGMSWQHLHQPCVAAKVYTFSLPRTHRAGGPNPGVQ